MYVNYLVILLVHLVAFLICFFVRVFAFTRISVAYLELEPYLCAILSKAFFPVRILVEKLAKQVNEYNTKSNHKKF